VTGRALHAFFFASPIPRCWQSVSVTSGSCDPFLLFLSTKAVMPSVVPFPSSVVQPGPQEVAMTKETHDKSKVTGTMSAPSSKLKRHKHYYMHLGNIIIQVCSVTLRHIILNSKASFFRLKKHCLSWISKYCMPIPRF
jgi:hypothetical protein